ncbi:AP-1 complex subunit gamma-like 2 isoform X1 [Chelonia mydas]|uniref:AP-1 complex subunit gamma-like 2 isoform X1 n=1 Tax=Chelonia mydas TaxID=8469 RepID=UPI0018A1DE94|nr:AP-1 complex subunit gamma-like 2 isoform X1 [Chelonia mydas]XP_037733056.1 AP-1 complex subunit gamma-like 2 isoform X1 [Chelonia mydas]XP_037733057.1 AP-1 complex subunit gamma-like 2 isoform X1 [Chelonia mydas]XP_043382768.1 AP-1 complex subunit gamma-like 2 isoform X1 [Chelonia mydas]XP_043382769.1 AP-1 complex subunit gamma-like 2 isoform X1 [Chelonia mydas]
MGDPLVTLPELIRAVRGARTQAVEQELVQRECARIRGAIRTGDPQAGTTNLTKLLYIHLLGYPAHFGQMECLKLLASPQFHQKRIGYLGAALLLDERQDAHLLLTNSIKNDLAHPSPCVQGLALACLGCLGSAGMCRDLAGEVQRLAGDAPAPVRRKAVACAVHMVRKVPELSDIFVPVCDRLLKEHSQGLLHGTLLLITEMCERSPDVLNHFRKAVPRVVEMLHNLEVSGYSLEHSIMGVSNPFLQVRALRLLRILGQGSEEASEAMNDTLAQVATNTETLHNVGSAVLYETVLTITAVHSAPGLRVLAVNILGRFLLSRDRNIRSVALMSLLRLVRVEQSALQRHRATVLACLRDPDPTIHRRALDLSLALMTGANVRTMTQELLGFLETCPLAMKPPCASGLLFAAERFAPNKRWHIDTMLQVLTMAGSSVPDDAVSRLIQLIVGAGELHPYIVRRLYGALACDISQQPLVQVATWCIGEYGDLLLADSCEEAEPVQVEEGQVLALLERVLQSHLSLPPTRALALTALMKLSTRLSGDIDRIRRIVSVFGSCHDIELQQRAVEYNALFRKYDHLRASVLEKMPLVKAEEEEGAEVVAPGGQKRAPSSTAQEEPSQVADLLDLLGGPPADPLVPAGSDTPVAESLLDLLEDVTTAPPIPPLTVWEGDGLRLDFAFQRPPADPHLLLITASASRTRPGTTSGFLLQAAVPKSLQVQLEAPSGTSVPGPDGAPLSQQLRVRNPGQAPLRMRLRLAYTPPAGVPVQETLEINDFPAAAWQ